MTKLEIRNLFLTRTALGVYVTSLSAIASVAISLAHRFDANGRLTATDWVIGVSTIVLTVTGQGVVMASRVGANGSLAYTPRGVWGPNKENVITQATRISQTLPREETYVEPPLEEQVESPRTQNVEAERSRSFKMPTYQPLQQDDGKAPEVESTRYKGFDMQFDAQHDGYKGE